ncbi:Thromboxane-A synthase [Rhizophlyctis rosea]|nr:Thromboxane-A synthase [Rhizophlyctis rosea]
MPFLSTLRDIPIPPPKTALLTAATVTATSYLIYTLLIPKRYKRNGTVPGPFEWPLFGSFFEALPYIKTGELYKWTNTLLERYGNIYRVNFGGLEMVIIRDAETAKMVLSQTRVDGDFGRDVPGSGRSNFPFIFPSMLFAMPTNQNWKRHREVLVPAFSPANLRFGMEASLEAAEDLCGALKSRCGRAEGGKVEMDIYEAMAAFTVDVIGKLAFSYEFHTAASLEKEEMNKDVELLNSIFMIIAKRIFTPPLLWSFLGLSTSTPDVAEAITYLKTIVTDVIREKRAGKAAGHVGGRRDLLDQMMDKSFTDEELFEEVVGFFLAGHETTSNTLMYTFLELCRNPSVYQKLMTEIETNLPTSDAPLTLEKLPAFRYLEQTIKETQRFHTVVGGVGRRTRRDMDIMGHRIAKGTLINLPIRQLHGDPRYWDEPEKFDPERFAEGRPAPVAGSYLPFSDGPHNCIGAKLALIESKVALIQMLRNFNVELVPGQAFKYKGGVTTTIEGGVRVLLSVRG